MAGAGGIHELMSKRVELAHKRAKMLVVFPLRH
jgi:hypothetical protein